MLAVDASAVKLNVIVRVFMLSQTVGLPSAGECCRLVQVSVPDPVVVGAGLALTNASFVASNVSVSVTFWSVTSPELFTVML